MTREELQELLAKHDQEFGKPEDPLAKWKREAKEQEERFARERAKARNLTDSEMARWRAYSSSLSLANARRRRSSFRTSGSFTAMCWPM